MEIEEKDVGHIIGAINAIRANPNTVIAEVKAELGRFESSSVFRTKSGTKIRTSSGKQAWQQCLLALERQKPKGPLEWNDLLGQAAHIYKEMITNGDKANPFDVIKDCCSYEGSIAFLENECDSSQSTQELMSSMVVCDGDQSHSARKAIYHPLYKNFGCSIRKQGTKYIIYSIFAETIREPLSVPKGTKSFKTEKVENSIYSDERPIKGATQQQQSPQKVQISKGKNSLIQSFQKGRQLVQLLNKIRKEPKQYIQTIKAMAGKFKSEKDLVMPYGTITTKEGEAPFYDFISELQAQYPLPVVHQSVGLSVASIQHFQELHKEEEAPTSLENLIGKYTLHLDGLKIMKFKDIRGDGPVQDILIRILAGDGDKKKTARKKLMSPVTKAVGCCIGEDLIIINTADGARDNHDVVQEYLDYLQNKMQPKLKQVEKEVPKPVAAKQQLGAESGDKVVTQKKSRTFQQKRGNRTYEIRETTLVYQDGQIEKLCEENLIG